MEGTVIKNTGSSYIVRTDDGTEMPCKIKGNFRIKGIRTTNPVAVGDKVEVRPSESGDSYITAISPRRNYIIRRSSNLSKEAHIIAANIDSACLVATLFHPVTSTTFIDRFLATAEAYVQSAIRLFILPPSQEKELMNCGSILPEKPLCCPATAVWGNPHL